MGSLTLYSDTFSVVGTPVIKFSIAKTSCCSTSAQWDLISEKLCIEVNGERKIIFRSRLNCAMNYTYDVCQS